MLSDAKKYLSCAVFCLALNGCASYPNGFESFYRSLLGTPETVQVNKGDTLYSIAKRYDMTIDELIELNGIDSPNDLKVGQILKTTSNRYYIVKRGDTLASIARRHHTNYKIIASKNNLKPPFNLKVGQKLTIDDTPSKAYTSAKPVSQSKTASKKASKKASKTVSKKTTQKTTSKKSTQKTTFVSTTRGKKFMWPVSGKIISNFGTLGKGRKNDGINISAAKGTTVKAGDGGTVAYAGNGLKGFGNLILIKHNDGYITAYAHTDQMFVKKGQKVSRGQKIATVGQTGGVTTPQLHFEVRAGKKAVNPRKYLP